MPCFSLMNKKVTVEIFVESRYKVNRKKIAERVEYVVHKKGVASPVEVSVAVVGDRKMRALNKKYRGIDSTTNVLSFPQSEGEPGMLPSDILVLGDVVVSYPVVIKEAAAENMLVDEKICELVEHGTLHLLGEHH